MDFCTFRDVCFYPFPKVSLDLLITTHTRSPSEICHCSFKRHRNRSLRVGVTDICLTSTLLKKLGRRRWMRLGEKWQKDRYFFRIWNEGDGWNDVRSADLWTFLSDVTRWVCFQGPRLCCCLKPAAEKHVYLPTQPVFRVQWGNWPRRTDLKPAWGEKSKFQTLPSRDYEAIFKRFQGQKSLP